MLLQEQFLEFKRAEKSSGKKTQLASHEKGFQLQWSETTQSLLFVKDEEECVVIPKPCFPWSQPLKKISLRDYENEEKAFVSEIEDLDDESKKALLQALKEACFYFAVVKIESIKDDFELRVWKVMTHQGPRSFQTKLTGWPTMVGPGRYIIRDVHKDLYVIENLGNLDAKSQELFWPLSEN